MREVDLWTDLFPQLVIAAPCRDCLPPSDCLPFSSSNITIAPQLTTGGDTALAKALQVLALPRLVWDLARAMRRADAIHVRCPGNLGLLGILMAPLFSRYLIAKYAGSWRAFPGENWTYRLQRAILRSGWWRGPVTVYGYWPEQPRHVVPFFNSVMTEKHMARAQVAARQKQLGNPLRILYVGRLSREKNVDILLSAIANLLEQGIRLPCRIVGTGPMRQALEARAANLGLEGQVIFTGGVDFEKVLEYYEQSDVLVLVSQSEGWGKAIVEAMAFGLVCIGSENGPVALFQEGRGIVIPARDVLALSNALQAIALAPENYRAMSTSAAAWAARYSVEGLEDALRSLIAEYWNISLTTRPEPAVLTATE